MRRLALLVAVLALAACDFQQNLADAPTPGGARGPAPEFSGAEVTPATAATFDLQGERGHVVVVDFWGSWCGPCRKEQPDLTAVATRYTARGVVFIGVAMRDDTASVRAYQNALGVPYPTVMDGDESIAGAYNVAAPPSVVVIDRHGNVAQRFLGTTTGMAAELDYLLSAS